MAYVNAVCAGRVTIFSTGGNIPPGFEFYVVTHSYSSRPFFCALGLPIIMSHLCARDIISQGFLSI